MRRMAGPLLGALITALGTFTSASAGGFQRGDPAARLDGAKSANERWDLMALFDDGQRLFVRFLVTNEGPGEKTAACTGHWTFADGRVHSFHMARRKGRWSAGEDGLRIFVSSATLELRAAERGLEIQSSSRRTKISLQFPSAEPATWDARDSRPPPALDLVQISPVEGSVQVADMQEPVAVRGRIALTHAWTSRRESELAQRWLEVFALAGDVALYAADLQRPDGSHWPWLALQRGGHFVEEGAGAALIQVEPNPTRNGAYPVPRRLTVQSGPLQASFELDRELIRADPLKILPQPFRFILSLSTKPRRIWSNASFQLILGSETLTGSAVVALWYLNPTP